MDRFQLYPDLEIPRKTPGQVLRDTLDGSLGILGGIVRTPYATAKGFDDVVDIVKGQDMDDDTVIPRALEFLNDAANAITPDSNVGKFGDEYIGQTIGPGGVLALGTKGARKLPVLAGAAQANIAPIAGQLVEDMGGDATERLMAEIAVGGAPTNFGNHRNKTDVVIGRKGVTDPDALAALDDAEGIYRDTGGANYGFGEIDKKQANKLREEVRQDTGAYVGPDGLPRLEVYDDYIFGQRNPADLMNSTVADMDGMKRIVDLVPQLKRTQLYPVMNPQVDYLGAYDRDNNRILFNHFGLQRAPRSAMSVLSHELQHAIQDFTGLPGGGNQAQASLYGKTNLGRFSDAINKGEFKRGNKTIRVAGGESILDPNKGDNAQFMSQIEDMRTHYGRGNEYDRYLRIAGEGEARQTQDRLFKKPEYRVQNAPVIPGANDYYDITTLSGRIDPRQLTVRLDEAEQMLGARLARSGQLSTGGVISPVAEVQMKGKPRGSLAAQPRDLPDQARVTLGYLYDLGLID